MKIKWLWLNQSSDQLTGSKSVCARIRVDPNGGTRTLRSSKRRRLLQPINRLLNCFLWLFLFLFLFFVWLLEREALHLSHPRWFSTAVAPPGPSSLSAAVLWWPSGEIFTPINSPRSSLSWSGVDFSQIFPKIPKSSFLDSGKVYFFSFFIFCFTGAGFSRFQRDVFAFLCLEGESRPFVFWVRG